jgi:hypothetical protein
MQGENCHGEHKCKEIDGRKRVKAVTGKSTWGRKRKIVEMRNKRSRVYIDH